LVDQTDHAVRTNDAITFLGCVAVLWYVWPRNRSAFDTAPWTGIGAMPWTLGDADYWIPGPPALGGGGVLVGNKPVQQTAPFQGGTITPSLQQMQADLAVSGYPIFN
jgi:hypothetical protein